MKNTMKTLALASAFAIASFSAMVPKAEADYGFYAHCSSGGSNCTIDIGGWSWTGGLDIFIMWET